MSIDRVESLLYAHHIVTSERDLISSLIETDEMQEGHRLIMLQYLLLDGFIRFGK